MKKYLGLKWLLLAACSVAALPSAYAQNSAAKEIIWFRAAKVGLSPGAADCNLRDANFFASYLSDRLQAIGIARNSNSRLVATLSIAASGFGFLGSQCAYNVTFQFQTVLMPHEINTPDPRVRAALNRLGHLPVSIYQDGMFGVVAISGSSDRPNSVEKKVNEAISALTERLKIARQR